VSHDVGVVQGLGPLKVRRVLVAIEEDGSGRGLDGLGGSRRDVRHDGGTTAGGGCGASRRARGSRLTRVLARHPGRGDARLRSRRHRHRELYNSDLVRRDAEVSSWIIQTTRGVSFDGSGLVSSSDGTRATRASGFIDRRRALGACGEPVPGRKLVPKHVVGVNIS
jgi:hypothetical protein